MNTVAAILLFDLACLVVVVVWAWQEGRKGGKYQPAGVVHPGEYYEGGEIPSPDDWGRPVIGLDEAPEPDALTPIHDALAAQTLRAELDDDAAVARWLS